MEVCCFRYRTWNMNRDHEHKGLLDAKTLHRHAGCYNSGQIFNLELRLVSHIQKPFASESPGIIWYVTAETWLLTMRWVNWESCSQLIVVLTSLHYCDFSTSIFSQEMCLSYYSSGQSTEANWLPSNVMGKVYSFTQVDAVEPYFRGCSFYALLMTHIQYMKPSSTKR